MASYLPRDSSGSSPYAEGGGLYAIGEWPLQSWLLEELITCDVYSTAGLIHANHGLNMMDYLSKELRNTSEVSSDIAIGDTSVYTC